MKNKAPMAPPEEFKGPEADALPDTATLPADLAALYLCMSPAQLADLRKSKRPEKSASNSPSTIRPVEGGPAGPKDPVLYQLGTLREYAKAHAGPSDFDTALNSGMLGWVSAKLPFFAEREPRIKRGKRVLIGGAWDRADPLREKRFIELAKGRIRFTSLTCAEAAASLWADIASHAAFAEKGLALLRAETQAIEASLAATRDLAAASNPDAAA
ncbi:hypothetical protein NU688_12145 [Variovorax sp. ZS18.2.2]|uniref:hypothetical protein n=1 Tax=Variovorax sp. ZS18.2.2 TaxID=2971255 RepID=UPI00215140BC|nr:hypothetical protein [Variovorax sp. ZS18.2.2]MCR6476902.1 hypothetical protein [Variovorax sp. ZS18.2.2]